MSADRCIGRGGALPWHYREDLQHFKALTTGHAIIMGRATFASIGRPLPNRSNIVLSRTLGPTPGIEIASDLEEALTLARRVDDNPFVIGGSRVYRDALPFVTDIHLTRVPEAQVAECDAFFPAFSEERFACIASREGVTPGLVFTHWQLRRRAEPPAT